MAFTEVDKKVDTKEKGQEGVKKDVDNIDAGDAQKVKFSGEELAKQALAKQEEMRIMKQLANFPKDIPEDISGQMKSVVEKFKDINASVGKVDGTIFDNYQGTGMDSEKAVQDAKKSLEGRGFVLENGNYVAETSDIIYEANGKNLNSGSVRKLVIPESSIVATEKDGGGYSVGYEGYAGYFPTANDVVGIEIPNASEIVSINDF